MAWFVDDSLGMFVDPIPTAAKENWYPEHVVL